MHIPLIPDKNKEHTMDHGRGVSTHIYICKDTSLGIYIYICMYVCMRAELCLGRCRNNYTQSFKTSATQEELQNRRDLLMIVYVTFLEGEIWKASGKWEPRPRTPRGSKKQNTQFWLVGYSRVEYSIVWYSMV